MPIDPNDAIQERRAEQEKAEREAPTKFGANGRDEEEQEEVVPIPRGKKGKKAAKEAAAALARGEISMEVDADYVEPLAEVAEVEEDPEEAALQAEIEAEIARADEDERAQKKKKRKA